MQYSVENVNTGVTETLDHKKFTRKYGAQLKREVLDLPFVTGVAARVNGEVTVVKKVPD
jgi:hypothetical protein